MSEVPFVLIVYASVTGTAEDVAYRIQRHLRRLDVLCDVIDMCEMEPGELLCNTNIIFVMCTTGQGEVPPSAERMWSSLLDTHLPETLLEELSFTIIGLGDSSYIQYNWAAKKFNRRLLNLGATEFIPLTLADDQEQYGIESTFPSFLTSLTDYFNKISDHKRIKLHPNLSQQMPSRIQLIPVDGPVRDSSSLSKVNEVTESQWTNVLMNHRVTPQDHFQDVRFLQLDCLTDPSDIVQIYPQNSSSDVEKFLKYANWSEVADIPYLAVSRYPESATPEFIRDKVFTLRELLETELDIHGTPKFSFFEIMSWFAPEGEIKEKFNNLISQEGQDILIEYSIRARRTCVEIMHDFGITVHVPPEYIFDLLSKMRPRDYSVCIPSGASIPSKEDTSLFADSYLANASNKTSLLIAMVNYRTRFIKAPRIGLCTNYLQQEPQRLKYHVRKSLYRVPCDCTPVIFIGTGTGIAPCFAHLSTRINAENYMNLVFFGFRSKGKDMYFQSTFESWAQQSKIKFFPAASRDEPECPKSYVQDQIASQGELVWSFLDAGGVIFLSGSSKNMPKRVREVIISIVDTFASNGEQYVNEMMSEGRFIQDTWD